MQEIQQDTIQVKILYHNNGCIFLTPSCIFFNKFKKFLFVSDCSKLPKSMTKKANRKNHFSKNRYFPKGCPGAVWSNGKPSKKYCRGKMDKDGYPKFLWWNTCCIWKGSKCRDNPKFKSKKNVIVSIGTMVEVPGPPYDITKAKTIVDISRHLN